MIAPSTFNRVRYKLYNEFYGETYIADPLGWDDDEKEFARNEDYHGIFTSFSNSLTFVGDSADFITLIYSVYDIEGEIKLTKEQRHPKTDLWVTAYQGELDLSTYAIENNQVSVKFNSSGLYQVLKARESEKIEIERTTTLEGRNIGDLETDSVYLEGRRIFLRSSFAEGTPDNIARASVASQGNTRYQACAFPISVTANSHQEIAHDVPPYITTGVTSYSTPEGTTNMMFMINTGPDTTYNFSLSGSADFYIEEYAYINWARAQICLTKYENGTNYDVKERIELFALEDNHPYFYDGGSHSSFNYLDAQFVYDNANLELKTGESLALELFIGADFDIELLQTEILTVSTQNINLSMFIENNSYFEPTYSKMLLSHDLGQRLIQILTNRDDAFYSKVLGRTDLGYSQDGEFSLTGFTHGFWVRGFDKEPQDDENKYNPFTTTFKDYIANEISVKNLGLGIERVGYKDRIIVAKQEYFYNNNVTIRLPKQVKVKRSIATDFYCSGIEAGFEKGGEYEEAMGLDEYNTQSNFITAITRVQNTFSFLSKYRADAYGMEFARRKQKDAYPTEDTSYDKDIFLLDLKRFGLDFIQRKWQDDFEEAPEGVFSPETATNLRFSPVNIILRHGWKIAAGLTKFSSKYLRYGANEANSNLTTKLIGGKKYRENDDIRNSDLDRARFIPQWLEFEHEVDFEILEQLEGSTNILGENVPNIYGLVEFKNENNESEKGFLFNLKPNGAGEWKLLKANR